MNKRRYYEDSTRKDNDMRSAEEILKDIVSSVNEMRLKRKGWSSSFGPFTGEQSHRDYSVEIEWPNLDLLVKEAETAMKGKT